MRIDKFLKVSRILKRRTVAQEACDGDKVLLNGRAAKPSSAVKPGDVVEIPANVKHWHGAKAGCWFSHLAFGFPGEDVSNEWLEPVDDEQYAKLDR